MKTFAIIGPSGYIAPRHMQAIKKTGNKLVAAYDPHDSVGVIDTYFPQTDFFTEFERFDRHIDKQSRLGQKVDFISICSPNYLHDSHIRFGLRNRSDVICEKPMVLNPWNMDALAEIEKESENKIYTILQLRLHPTIVALKEKIKNGPKDKIYDIDLSYLTSRGNWYYTSWKGDIQKSGGIATNIGIHFFDMLYWIFGELKQNTVHLHTHDRASGYLEFTQARVRWFLSINHNTLPKRVRTDGKRTYRSIKVEGEELEFSDGFTDLHTLSYDNILSGMGFGISDSRTSIDIAHNVRHQTPIGLKGDYHPFAKLPLSKHPFSI